MITWPSVLPAPRIGISYNPVNNLVVNQMEGGNVRQRQRFTGDGKYYNILLSCTPFQVEVFEAFVKHSLADGANKFNFPLPVGTSKVLTDVEVLISNGSYQVLDLSGGINWEIGFTVVCEIDTGLSALELEAAILYGENYEAEFAAGVDAVTNIFPKDWEQ